MKSGLVSEESGPASMVQLRLRRKQHLAAACRIFAHFGFEQGAAGHLSVRDPELSSCFWLNPFGVHLGRVRASDLVLIDEHGHLCEGNGPINPAAVTIHGHIHKVRPDVIGIAHAHSLFGKTWSTLDRLLDPITQDACAFYQDHVLFSGFNGIIDSDQEGAALAQALSRHKAAILTNHGLLTVGSSIGAAAWWFISMDRCCHSQLLAEAAGQPKLIPHEIAERTKRTLGAELAAERSFSALFQHLTMETLEGYE
jgi:ribulose-5-phosphate 4-epimerase/fuculose-1-phosphate aldolase